MKWTARTFHLSVETTANLFEFLNFGIVVLLIGVIVLVGALTFFPALLLGPIVQALTGHLYH